MGFKQLGDLKYIKSTNSGGLAMRHTHPYFMETKQENGNKKSHLKQVTGKLRKADLRVAPDGLWLYQTCFITGGFPTVLARKRRIASQPKKWIQRILRRVNRAFLRPLNPIPIKFVWYDIRFFSFSQVIFMLLHLAVNRAPNQYFP